MLTVADLSPTHTNTHTHLNTASKHACIWVSLLSVFEPKKTNEIHQELKKRSISPSLVTEQSLLLRKGNNYIHNLNTFYQVFLPRFSHLCPYFQFLSFIRAHLLPLLNTHIVYLHSNLYNTHWTHISKYLYSNTHTLAQCPSLPHPHAQASINGNPVPVLQPAGRAVLAQIPQRERRKGEEEWVTQGVGVQKIKIEV